MALCLRARPVMPSAGGWTRSPSPLLSSRDGRLTAARTRLCIRLPFVPRGLRDNYSVCDTLDYTAQVLQDPDKPGNRRAPEPPKSNRLRLSHGGNAVPCSARLRKNGVSADRAGDSCYGAIVTATSQTRQKSPRRVVYLRRHSPGAVAGGSDRGLIQRHGAKLAGALSYPGQTDGAGASVSAATRLPNAPIARSPSTRPMAARRSVR